MQIIAMLLGILKNLGAYKSHLAIAFATLVALNAQFHFIPEATMETLIAVAVALGIWTVNDGPKKVEAKIEALDAKWSAES